MNGSDFFHKNIKFKTPLLRSDLCDYSDVCIVTKGTKDLLAAIANENDEAEKGLKIKFKNNAPFRSRLSKINNTLIENAEDLDIVMPMYNLLAYSYNYLITSRYLRWRYLHQDRWSWW